MSNLIIRDLAGDKTLDKGIMSEIKGGASASASSNAATFFQSSFPFPGFVNTAGVANGYGQAYGPNYADVYTNSNTFSGPGGSYASSTTHATAY
jgi:uncharacterized protein (DUF697 family)